jgi:hypothetical protein
MHARKVVCYPLHTCLVMCMYVCKAFSKLQACKGTQRRYQYHLENEDQDQAVTGFPRPVLFNPFQIVNFGAS